MKKGEMGLKVFITFAILLFIFFIVDLCFSKVIVCDSFGCEFVPAIQLIPTI
ncbi:MAG: hypothetical protein QW412_02065 [Candidatus Aenigmatarchaeota archaeon]